MATLLERFNLIRDDVLRQRMTAALWDKALRVLRDAGSTTAQKGEARIRLKRPLTDQEWAELIAYFGANGGTKTSDDAAIQTAVDAAYNALPTAT